MYTLWTTLILGQMASRPQDSDRNVVKLAQNQTTPKMVWERRKDGVRERKDGVRERKIEPKPVSNTPEYKVEDGK